MENLPIDEATALMAAWTEDAHSSFLFWQIKNTHRLRLSWDQANAIRYWLDDPKLRTSTQEDASIKHYALKNFKK